ncbi:UDP-N-acetylmuramate dehydrogenase [Glycocaulis sp.]|uniref:UDP-N-acetylmuramate dehydrogenase n=1 Tax=Glycocaulis sp. TaxID=1969725 RepID=UPI0025C46D99|nr:UDP-N-acetylmuramate dehydrogenase [Glycocaulis sp.]MCH8522312.1 UDP-N-acetylmuramate dehydrogenase [Glycocaulis sp.]
MTFPSLLPQLPEVRGQYIENAPLSDITWLRVGGPAQVLYLPADEADLARFLAETHEEIPVHVLGAGSNTLVRDGGVPGVVIRLTPAFARTEVLEGNRIRIGAALLDKMAAKAAAKAGIAGLEFYVGVPGTIGGAIRMNAGCYGSETKDVLVEAIALDRRGRRLIVKPDELGHAYRHCSAPEDWIFTEAVFEGRADAPAAILERMDAISEKRAATQPIREKTSGSTFKNPDQTASKGRSAWQLVEAVGGRGRRKGGARFSEMHANFLINDGSASAADLEGLVEDIRAEIAAREGVDMHWEVKRIGLPERETP